MGRIIPFLLALAWLAIIFFLSSQNGTQTTGLSFGLAGAVCKVLRSLGIQADMIRIHHFLRTFAHVFVFFVEGILLFWAFFGTLRKRAMSALVALLVSVPLCALDELHKLAIPGRHCQWDEAGLNLLGAALAIGCSVLIAALMGKTKLSSKDN